MKFFSPLLKFSFTLWCVSTLVFSFIHIVPSNPIDIMLGENASAVDRDALNEKLGLNKPLLSQYSIFLNRTLHLDFGESIVSKKSVRALIAERIPATIQLTFWALLIAIFVAIPIGVFSAVFSQSFLDRLSYLLSVLGTSLPSFVLGPLLMLLFSIHLRLLPISEKTNWVSTILPALTLAIGLTSVLLRMVRSSMLEALSQDYILTAKSKGLSEKIVYFKHALKNAMLPVITLFCLQLGGLLAGTVITETIFDWPGIGELTYRALQSRDYPLVQGCILAITAAYVSANFLADYLYLIFNPRIYEE